jgi:hypothetical protein
MNSGCFIPARPALILSIAIFSAQVTFWLAALLKPILVEVKDFYHGRPPFTFQARLQGDLHRTDHGPPPLRLGVFGHSPHVPVEIVTGVFEITKKDAIAQKD